MSDKIIHCEWIDAQPDFKKDVIIKDKDGKDIVLGTMHALTGLEMNEINRKCPITTENEDKDMMKMTYLMIIYALTGHDCGWNFDRELSIENLDMMYPDYKKKFIEVLNSFYVTEAVSKN